jgi:cytoskeleton protein RodZ
MSGTSSMGASTTTGGSTLPVSLSATPAMGSPAAAPAVLALPAEPSLKASAAAQVAPPGQATTGILVFRAKGESWIEVTDAKGTVVLRRTLAAGEVAGASGVLPLAAVIGRADATQVQVRGKAFDLSDVTKDNVARFEVK